MDLLCSLCLKLIDNFSKHENVHLQVIHKNVLEYGFRVLYLDGMCTQDLG